MTKKSTKRDCLLLQVVPYGTEDREVERDLLVKAGYDMSHPDVDAMWNRSNGYPGQNLFPEPLYITDDVDGGHWSLVEISLWNQKRVEAIIARAQESLAAVVHELEVASQGRMSVLQHFLPEGQEDY